jgi:hypothetical protein
VIAYKFLRFEGTSSFTGFRWELPNGNPGQWVHARIDPCRSGITRLTTSRCGPCKRSRTPLADTSVTRNEA